MTSMHVPMYVRYTGPPEDLRRLLQDLGNIQGLELLDNNPVDGDLVVALNTPENPEKAVALGKLRPPSAVETGLSLTPLVRSSVLPSPSRYRAEPAMSLNGQVVSIDQGKEDFTIKFLANNKVEISLAGRKLLEAEVKDGKLHLAEHDRKSGGGTEIHKTEFAENKDGSFTIKLPNAVVVLDAKGKGGKVIAGDQIATRESGGKVRLTDGGFAARTKHFDGIDNWVVLNGSNQAGIDDVALHVVTVDEKDLSRKVTGLGQAKDKLIEDGYLPAWGTPAFGRLFADWLLEEQGIWADYLEAGLKELRTEIKKIPNAEQRDALLKHYGIESEEDLKKTALETAESYIAATYRPVALPYMVRNQFEYDPAGAVAAAQALQSAGVGSQEAILSLLKKPEYQELLGSLTNHFPNLAGEDGATQALAALGLLLQQQNVAGRPLQNSEAFRAAALRSIAERARLQDSSGSSYPSLAPAVSGALLSNNADLMSLVQMVLLNRNAQKAWTDEELKTLGVDVLKDASAKDLAVVLPFLDAQASSGNEGAKALLAEVKKAEGVFNKEQVAAIKKAVNYDLKPKTGDVSATTEADRAQQTRPELDGEMKAIRDRVDGLLANPLGRDSKQRLREILGAVDGKDKADIAAILDDIHPQRLEYLVGLQGKYTESISGALKGASERLTDALNSRRYGPRDGSLEAEAVAISTLLEQSGRLGGRPADAIERLARLDQGSLEAVVDKVGFEKMTEFLNRAEGLSQLSSEKFGYGPSIARIKAARDRVRENLSDDDVKNIAKNFHDRLWNKNGLGGLDEVSAKSALLELTTIYSPKDQVRIVREGDGGGWANVAAKLTNQNNAVEDLKKLREALSTAVIEGLSDPARKERQDEIKLWLHPLASGDGALWAVHSLGGFTEAELPWILSAITSNDLQRMVDRLGPEDVKIYGPALARILKVAGSEGLAVTPKPEVLTALNQAAES